ncbi:Hypothetical protein CINCED_3A006206 [Cinara cedri]|uniref:Uncharacterized protein n=1 Tax=Cinara cedri TaxID=506608 RepID=A0A5E4LX49_9HEMI|nr:Hypothetical protein CINCED_3A006206 [Cinara cedri]
MANSASYQKKMCRMDKRVYEGPRTKPRYIVCRSDRLLKTMPVYAVNKHECKRILTDTGVERCRVLKDLGFDRETRDGRP